MKKIIGNNVIASVAKQSRIVAPHLLRGLVFRMPQQVRHDNEGWIAASRVALLAMTVVVFLAMPAYALAPAATDKAEQTVVFLSQSELAKNQKTIDLIGNYLSELTTVVSDFTQVAPDGTLTNGKFYLQRPGRMRWQYNPPTPILMVANSSELIYYDIELEQVSHIPLDSTLIGFLAQDKITFDKNVGIISFETSAGVIRVTLAQHDKPNDGQLQLEFSDKPLLIRNMVITDATNQVTNVSLNNARFGLKIDSKLFEFHDPRKPRKMH